jgi:hypothetical protein
VRGASCSGEPACGGLENGRSLLNDVPIERQQAQLEIARQSGIVRGEQEKQGLMTAYWVINERFRPALEDLLYERTRDTATGSTFSST